MIVRYGFLLESDCHLNLYSLDRNSVLSTVYPHAAENMALNPQQTLLFQETAFYIQKFADTAPPPAYRKLFEQPGIGKLLRNAARHRWSAAKEHSEQWLEAIKAEKECQDERDKSKGTMAVLKPNSDKIIKKRKIDQRARAADLSKLMLPKSGSVGTLMNMVKTKPKITIAGEKSKALTIRHESSSGSSTPTEGTANGGYDTNKTPTLNPLTGALTLFGNVGSGGEDIDVADVHSADEVPGSTDPGYVEEEEGEEEEEEEHREYHETGDTMKLKKIRLPKRKRLATTANDSDNNRSASATPERTASPDETSVYQLERDLVHQTDSALSLMKAGCQKHKLGDKRIDDYRFDQEIREVFHIGAYLSASRVTYSLVTYLIYKSRHPNIKAQIPRDWNMDDPITIYNAIEVFSAQGEDTKLHRAYAQMQLFVSVTQKVNRAISLGGAHTGLANPAYGELEHLADRQVGTEAPENVRGKARRAFRSRYQQGKNWLEMAQHFGGTGTVFVFVIAGNNKLPSSNPLYQHLQSFQTACSY